MAPTKAQLWLAIRGKRAELNTFVARRDKLRKIQQSLVDNFDNNVTDIENKRGKAQVDLSRGISGSGMSKIASMQTKMNNTAQPLPVHDTVFNDAKWNINQEINRCQGIINTLNSQIIQLQNQYNNTP